ncbi:MAG: hypothetical protein BMS9Abin30_0643 [Gammaproteobacteria bacterium]|nr:MAG: hypothetical protein BMS9Abin30_0643 [Gammaproteobacteria bacterium]
MKEHKKSRIGRRLKGLMFRRIHGMITCREFEEFINNFLDGELSKRERSRFGRHLRICRECRQYLQAYQRTIEIGRAVFTSPDEPVPDDVPESLIDTILKLRADNKTGD